MMRFILFSESHKKPLRKDEINKNVMKNYKNRKLYDEIFTEAKYQLLDTFGYEVVELIPEVGSEYNRYHYIMIADCFVDFREKYEYSIRYDQQIGRTPALNRTRRNA